jgi:hypothetical protein
MSRTITTRREQFARRIAAGLNPNAATRGLNLHATRELKRADVAALIEQFRQEATSRARGGAPEPGPAQSSTPRVLTPICDGCGRRVDNSRLRADGRYCTTCYARKLIADEQGTAGEPIPYEPLPAPVPELQPYATSREEAAARGAGTTVVIESCGPSPSQLAGILERGMDAADSGTYSAETGQILWESDRQALAQQILNDRLARMGDRSPASPQDIMQWRSEYDEQRNRNSSGRDPGSLDE